MTDSLERSYYNLYCFMNNKQSAVPNPVSLPFNSEYVASSNFTNNTLSLSTLYAKDDEYNYLHENVPSLVNLQRPAFVGLTKGNSSLPIKINAASDGNYRILLHGASKQNIIRATIDGADISLQKVKEDQGKTGDYIDFTYFYADVSLPKGAHTLSLKNADTNAVLVDSATLMPQGDIPLVDGAQIISPKIKITPTVQPLIYDIRME